MCGGVIHAPCINNSDHPNCIRGKNIYLGFGYLKNLEALTISRILTERQLHGPFRSFEDFLDRVPISIEQITILIRINTFRFTNIPKNELMWQMMFKLNKTKKVAGQKMLFRPEQRNFTIPKLECSWLEEAYDQMELLGFPLCDYFDLVDEELKSDLKTADLPSYKDKNVLIYGILVNTRFHRTCKGEKMRFSTFTDLEGEFFDAVHFSNVVDKFPIWGQGVYACYGKVTEEFDFYSLDIIWSKKTPLKPDP